MKYSIILFSLVIWCSCNNKKTAETKTDGPAKSDVVVGETKSPGNGSFQVDGKEYSGEITTQYFGDKVTGQYSVLCQQDDPLVLLQIVFSNEGNALKGSALETSSGYITLAPNEVHVSLSGSGIGTAEFISPKYTPGTVSVSGRKVIIKDLQLKDYNNEHKIINATLPF